MKTLTLPIIAGLAIFVSVLVGGEVKKTFANFDQALGAKIAANK